MSKAPMDSPYEMKAEDKTSAGLTPTTKSYNNIGFMNCPDARTLRILTEFAEPACRLHHHDVRGTILFFGSARSMGKAQYDKTLSGITDSLAKATTDEEKASLNEKATKFKKVEWMCKYVDLTEALAKKITQWSTSCKEIQHAMSKSSNFMTGQTTEAGPSKQPLLVTTGGGPGIMEAANKGASEVEGATTIGMGISLPFEKGLNPYVTDTLAFEFHYFFTRKYWMMYSAKALILGPGGFGTMDELFELMTLRQTGKIPDLPIVLLGTDYWKTVINWQALADFGVISQSEVDKLFFADDVDSAYEFLTTEMLKHAKKAKAESGGKKGDKKKADKKHVDPAPAPAPVALKNPTATPLIANFKKFAGDVSAYFMFINLEFTNDVCNFICGPEGFSPEEILTMLTNPKECTKLQDAYVKIAKTSAKKEEKTREEIAKLVTDFMDKKVGGVKTLKEAEEKAKTVVDPATAELIADFAAFVATKTQKHTTPKMFALVMDYLPEGFHPADIKTMLTNGEDCDELLETYVRLAVVPSADKLRVRNELVAFVEDYAESKGIVHEEMCF